jgi:TolA-binding protein
MIFPLRSCPPAWEITRAVSEGASATLQDHISQCADCRSLYDEEARLSSLAPSLAFKDFSLERRQGTRQKFLQEVAQRPSAPQKMHWGRWIALAASVALLAAGAYWFIPGEAPIKQAPSSIAKVISKDGALFTQERLPNQEKITLTTGKISVSASTEKPGERLLVATKDAEIVMYAASAEIFATSGEIESVYVFAGTIELRYLEQPAIIVSAGERWTKPEAIQSTTPSSEPTSIATSLPVQEPAPVASRPVKSNPGEEWFADGFALMREKKFEEAALAFGKAAKSRGSLQEDALFWQAMAWGRAQKQSESRAALESFLLQYPTSPRAGEAALALGWILFDAKDVEGARRWFKVAERDPSETVKQRAEDALQQLPSE